MDPILVPVTSWIRAHVFIVALAATIVFGVGLNIVLDSSLGGGAPAGTTIGGPTPDPMLEAAVQSALPNQRCTIARAAESTLRVQLEALGFAAWEVVRGPHVEDSTCVGAAIYAGDRRIMLVRALAPEVRESLRNVKARLLDECRTQEEARQMVSAVLDAARLTAWQIRTGGISGPLDRMSFINQHVDEGCWIYSGHGWTADGTWLFWIGGN